MSDSKMLKVYDILNASQIAALREQTKRMLRSYVELEKKLCRKHKIKTEMKAKSYDRVTDLIDKCSTGWEVHALKKLVFRFNQIPDFSRVEEYAAVLKSDAYNKNSGVQGIVNPRTGNRIASA